MARERPRVLREIFSHDPTSRLSRARRHAMPGERRRGVRISDDKRCDARIEQGGGHNAWQERKQAGHRCTASASYLGRHAHGLAGDLRAREGRLRAKRHRNCERLGTGRGGLQRQRGLCARTVWMHDYAARTLAREDILTGASCQPKGSDDVAGEALIAPIRQAKPLRSRTLKLGLVTRQQSACLYTFMSTDH